MAGDEDTRTAPPGGEAARDEEKSLRAEVISRLRAQLTLLRVQVRRLHDALHQAESLRASAQDRLVSLRGTTERLEQALLMEEAAQSGIAPARIASPVAEEGDAPSWQPVAAESRRPAECTVPLALADRHIHALLASGVLSINDVDHPAAIGRVVQTLIDRWSEQYRDRRSVLSDSVGTVPTLPAAGKRAAPSAFGFGNRAPGTFEARAADENTADDGGCKADVETEPALPAADTPPAVDNIVWLERPHTQHRGAAPRPHRSTSGDEAVVVFAGNRTTASRPVSRPSPQAFAGVNSERRPDPCEADDPLGGECLAEDEHRDGQMAGWGEVLQQSHRREVDAPGTRDE